MDKFYLSTIDENAQALAKQYGLGLEIAEYCTAWNLDEKSSETDTLVREKIKGISDLVFHAPFNELFPCAIDPKARELAAYPAVYYTCHCTGQAQFAAMGRILGQRLRYLGTGDRLVL